MGLNTERSIVLEAAKHMHDTATLIIKRSPPVTQVATPLIMQNFKA